MTVASTSAQLPPPPEVERMPFSLNCIRHVKNLVLKENTGIALALIGAEEVASHIDATATPVFDVKTRRDSPIKESDGGNSDLDYGDDERASVLPDEEDEGDEQDAEGGMVTSATAESDGVQLTHTSNPGKAISEDTADTPEDKDDGSDDKKHTSPREGSVSHDPVVLAAGRINKSASDHVQHTAKCQCASSHLLRPDWTE